MAFFCALGTLNSNTEDCLSEAFILAGCTWEGTSHPAKLPGVEVQMLLARNIT